MVKAALAIGGLFWLPPRRRPILREGLQRLLTRGRDGQADRMGDDIIVVHGLGHIGFDPKLFGEPQRKTDGDTGLPKFVARLLQS